MQFSYKTVCKKCRYRVTIRPTGDELKKLMYNLAIRQPCPSCGVLLDLRMSQGAILSSLSEMDALAPNATSSEPREDEPSPTATSGPEARWSHEPSEVPTQRAPAFSPLDDNPTRPQHRPPDRPPVSNSPRVVPFEPLADGKGPYVPTGNDPLSRFSRLPQWMQITIIIALLGLAVIVLAWPTDGSKKSRRQSAPEASTPESTTTNTPPAEKPSLPETESNGSEKE